MSGNVGSSDKTKNNITINTENMIQMSNQAIGYGSCPEMYEARDHARNWTMRKLDHLGSWQKSDWGLINSTYHPRWEIHNTIHISLLESYKDNLQPSQGQEPPPPITIRGEQEYKYEEIIHSRVYYWKLQYRAKWTGYSPKDDKV